MMQKLERGATSCNLLKLLLERKVHKERVIEDEVITYQGSQNHQKPCFFDIFETMWDENLVLSCFIIGSVPLADCSRSYIR